jgi:hypothetical protein
LPAQLAVTLENSPSKVAATDQAFLHFISMEAVAIMPPIADRNWAIALCRIAS